MIQRMKCLRYQTAQALPESYEMGEAVFPGALKNGKCSFFRKDEKVVLATGFLIDGNPLMNERFRARLLFPDYLLVQKKRLFM